MKTTKSTVPLRKINHRWAWMAGATAVAASSSAHASTAQITLVNNTLDSITGNHLSLAVTVGHPFGIITRTSVLGGASVQAGVGGNLGNSHQNFRFAAAFTAIANTFFVAVTHPGVANQSRFLSSPQKDFQLLPLKITDPNVAGGQANTNALLEVEAFNQSTTDQTVALLAVFYPTTENTAPNLTINSFTGAISGSYTNVGSSINGVFTPAAAPEPSGLALLAMGAGGILARRRRNKVAC